jgi:hypothetical protein
VTDVSAVPKRTAMNQAVGAAVFIACMARMPDSVGRRPMAFLTNVEKAKTTPPTTPPPSRVTTVRIYVQATTAGRLAVASAQGDEGMRRIWWDGQRVDVLGSAMRWLGANWSAFGEALLTE